MRTLIASLLCAAFAAAAPVPKELKKDDLARLEGEWQTVRAEFNGRDSNKGFLVFTRDTVNWKASREVQDVIWKLTVDASKSPKEFTIVHNGGRSTYMGLYKLDGDKLTLAYRLNAKPDGFTSEGGTFLDEAVRVVGKGK